MRKGLPADLVEFIVLNIDSIELIEVLELVQVEAAREWSAKELNQVIQSNLASIENRINQLMQLGFIVKVSTDPETFRYQPKNLELQSLSEKIVLSYRTRRVEVTELIYTQGMKEIISFSNAFKLKGSKKDG